MVATLFETLKVNVSLIFALLISSPASIRAETIPIPDNLNVPSGQQLILKASAKGSQIYVCTLKTPYPAQYEWTLKAPDAILVNEQRQYLAKHYAGPTWEAKDGSKVVAIVKSKAAAPQDRAIPWLLLEARSHEGDGIFRSVDWIQRVNTVGGKAPAQGCDESFQDREIRVNYTAEYLFYRD